MCSPASLPVSHHLSPFSGIDILLYTLWSSVCLRNLATTSCSVSGKLGGQMMSWLWSVVACSYLCMGLQNLLSVICFTTDEQSNPPLCSVDKWWGVDAKDEIIWDRIRGWSWIGFDWISTEMEQKRGLGSTRSWSYILLKLKSSTIQ